VDGGYLYLDVSIVVPDLDEARRIAKDNDQLGIFDLGNFKTIYTHEQSDSSNQSAANQRDTRQRAVAEDAGPVRTSASGRDQGAIQESSIRSPERQGVDQRLEAANSVESGQGSISAANFAVREGGDLIVPYGDFPQVVILRGRHLQEAKAAGMRVGPDGKAVVIQRVDAAAGNAMASELSSLLGKARRFFLGVPVYNGHPFHPDPEKRKEYADKRAFGWIKGVSNEADAVRMEVKWNPLGLEAVNDGHLAYHSPQWEMEKVGVENGMGIYRPVRLTSSGLTNEPNIPVPALVAANIAAIF
jgi:hypothetical protein